MDSDLERKVAYAVIDAAAERGMEMADLAQAAGIDGQRLCMIVTGQLPMEAAECTAICRALDLDPAALGVS